MRKLVVQGVCGPLNGLYSHGELLLAGEDVEIDVIGVLVVLCAESLRDLRQSCNIQCKEERCGMPMSDVDVADCPEPHLTYE